MRRLLLALALLALIAGCRTSLQTGYELQYLGQDLFYYSQRQADRQALEQALEAKRQEEALMYNYYLQQSQEDSNTYSQPEPNILDEIIKENMKEDYGY